MTSNQPLPPMSEDPSIVKGQEIKAAFIEQTRADRANISLNELEKAERITAAWNDANARLADLYRDLQERRRARLEVLDALVPLGPSIPSDATPADAVVIHQAFRTALADARRVMETQVADNVAFASDSLPGARPRGADALLEDAEKFDDDNLRRAVLTAALEAGNLRIVRKWTDLMGVTAQLEEYYELRETVAGRGPAGAWNLAAFGRITEPPEVRKLPALQEAVRRAAQGLR